MNCARDAREHLHSIDSLTKQLRPAFGRFWPLDFERKPKAVHSIGHKDYEACQNSFEVQYCGLKDYCFLMTLYLVDSSVNSVHVLEVLEGCWLRWHAVDPTQCLGCVEYTSSPEDSDQAVRVVEEH